VAAASFTTTALCMGRGGGVRTRGLEQRREGPTPTGTYAGYKSKIVCGTPEQKSRKNNSSLVAIARKIFLQVILEGIFFRRLLVLLLTALSSFSLNLSPKLLACALMHTNLGAQRAEWSCT
jgi:hypothetical protein